MLSTASTTEGVTVNERKAKWCRKYVENNIHQTPAVFFLTVHELDERPQVKKKLTRLYRIIKSGEKVRNTTGKGKDVTAQKE